MTLEFMAEDMAWTFDSFYPDFADTMYDGKWNPEFLNCMKALVIVAKNGFGSCYFIDSFLDSVKAGMFTPYDGVGKFLDENGDSICDVWSVDEVPNNAKFVLWFNK